MSKIIYPAVSTQTGSNQFSTAAAIYDFTDTFASLTSNQYVLLRTYFYNASGAAHAAQLYQASAAGVAANLLCVLENVTAVNSFSNSAPIEIRKANATSSYVLLMATLGKTGDGTIQISYSIESS